MYGMCDNPLFVDRPKIEEKLNVALKVSVNNLLSSRKVLQNSYSYSFLNAVQYNYSFLYRQTYTRCFKKFVRTLNSNKNKFMKIRVSVKHMYAR